MKRSLTTCTLAAFALMTAFNSNAVKSESPNPSQAQTVKIAAEMKEEKIAKLTEHLSKKFGAEPRSCLIHGMNGYFLQYADGGRIIYCSQQYGPTQTILNAEDTKGSLFGFSPRTGNRVFGDWIYKPYLAAAKNEEDFKAGLAIITDDELDAAYARANALAQKAANEKKMAEKQAAFEKMKSEILEGNQ